MNFIKNKNSFGHSEHRPSIYELEATQSTPSAFSLSLMETKPAADERSPEPKPENSCLQSFQQKEVLLFEWWLMKVEKGYNGRRLAVGGLNKRGKDVGVFISSPIIKRHDYHTLETADGITLRIQGPFDKFRTIANGFSLEASNAFFFGFPTTWDNFTEESSGNKPSDRRMLEHQPETTFDPSFQQKAVVLRDWWLRKAEKGSDGSRLAVGGFIECGKAMRLFDSSLIIKRHDAYTLETADGITIRIEGFINKTRTLDNGFPLEACKAFLIGFPTTWTDFANGSSRDKSSHAEIPSSASRDAEWSKDSLKNVPFEFPAKSGNNILDNVASTSNTSVRDTETRLREAIHEFIASVSMSNFVHMPLVDSGSHHLPVKSICDNNQLQDDESCVTIMIYAHTNNRLQDDDSFGTNMRDAHTVDNDYEYGEAGHTPVYNDSEKHEAGCTKVVHTEGARCLTSDLHVDGLPQEKSLNHEKLDFIQDATLNICKKCSGHALTKCHHDEGVGTPSTSVLWDSVVGKDHDKEEIARKKNEKFDECSTRRPGKVRSGMSKLGNLHGEDQKYAKFSVKPVRRSPRLMSLKAEKVNEEFQDYSQLLNETNDMNCANLAPGESKTCETSHPTNPLAEGCSLSPNLSLSAGVLPEEYQDGHQHSINTCLGVAPNSNSASKHGCCDDSASTACLGQSLNEKKTFLSDCMVGLVEETPANSKALASQTLEKRLMRRGRKKKENQTARSRMKVEQNDSRNQLSGTSFEENISLSSASNSRRKASHLTLLSDKSSSMKTNSEVAKNVEVPTETQLAEDKASHTIGYRTVWVSSYTDVHRTPLIRFQQNKLSILTPESLNFKRSRSGRSLIPRLDCSMRIMYEADGSFAGTATVDGSSVGTASVVLSTSQCKGCGTTLDRKKRKKQR